MARRGQTGDGRDKYGQRKFHACTVFECDSDGSDVELSECRNFKSSSNDIINDNATSENGDQSPNDELMVTSSDANDLNRNKIDTLIDLRAKINETRVKRHKKLRKNFKNRQNFNRNAGSHHDRNNNNNNNTSIHNNVNNHASMKLPLKNNNGMKEIAEYLLNIGKAIRDGESPQGFSGCKSIGQTVTCPSAPIQNAVPNFQNPNVCVGGPQQLIQMVPQEAISYPSNELVRGIAGGQIIQYRNAPVYVIDGNTHQIIGGQQTQAIQFAGGMMQPACVVNQQIMQPSLINTNENLKYYGVPADNSVNNQINVLSQGYQPCFLIRKGI